MPQAEGSAQARMQEQSPKIDKIFSDAVRLLRAAVAEAQHGDVVITIPLKAGIIERARLTPDFWTRY